MKPFGQRVGMNLRSLGPLAAALMLGGNAALAGSQSTAVVERVQVALARGAGPVLTNIAGVFDRQLQRRCGATVVRDGSAPFTLELAIEPGIGKEGFRITDGPQGGVRIEGTSIRLRWWTRWGR